MLRTANPALGNKTFVRDYSGRAAETMTITGTVNKTGIMLVLLLITAIFTWMQYFDAEDMGMVGMLMIIGAIGGLIFALITIFAKKAAIVTAPIYALCEGLFLGGISAMLESQYPGIVIQAVGLTFGTLFSLLFIYRLGIIKATENFKLGVVAATGGVFMVYLVTIILGFFGMSVPYIHGSGTIGIVFSLFVVVIAALNLVLDFDFIEQGEAVGAPKYMEWYAAFGLMVTLVWLYIEILRLLAKLNSRR